MKMVAFRVVLFAIACCAIGCGSQGPRVETTVGEAGGELELGSVTLTVPAGFVPEPVTVSIAERSSLKEALERDFGTDGYTVVGPAYELNFPFCAPVPIGLEMSYELADLPPGVATSNLAVFIYSELFYEPDPASSTEPEGLQSTGLFYLPTEVDEEGNVARANLFCAATAQLVAMTDAATVVPGWVPGTETAPRSAVLGLKLEVDDGPFIVVMLPEIADALDDQEREQVFLELRAGLSTAYGTLVGTRGFPAPPLGTMTVTAKKLPKGILGRVMPAYPTIIEVDPLQAARLTQSTVAHEFFHTIQNWSSNPASILTYFLNDRWFKEGSAEWARDEVFDLLSDHYQAPTAARFTVPLNEESAGGAVIGEHFLYETVAFWKWLEARHPQTILSLVQTQRELTHECSPSDSDRCIRNLDAVNYIDTLEGILQGLSGFDLVEFFADSLYWKNFDEDEKEVGDLWANLGAPQDVQFTFFGRDPIELRKGGEGDGLDNAKAVPYSVTPHLTADAMVVTNAESPLSLSGELHVKFRPSSSLADLTALVIARDSAKEHRVTGLDTEREVTVSFGPGSEVAILVVDSELEPSSSAALAGMLELWVEPEQSPCGELPGTIHRVNATNQLQSAIDMASDGDTILLAAGRYQLAPNSTLPPELPWDNGVWVIDRELTLAGSGTDATEIVVSDYSGYMWALDNPHTTYRDFKVTSGASAGFVAVGVERLTFCNVEAEFNTYTDHGVSVYTNFPGLPLAEQIDVIDSSFGGPDPREFSTTGLYIQPGQTPDSSANVTLFVRNSQFHHWLWGIFWSEAGLGHPTVALDIDDCAGFYEIDEYNICKNEPGTICVEQCPSN